MIRSSAAFSHHVVSVHGVPFADYSSDHGNCIVKSEEIECWLCGEMVLWDYSNMLLHFSTIHEMSLKEYYSSYIAERDIVALRGTEKRVHGVGLK
jgi:hypothetical protein